MTTTTKLMTADEYLLMPHSEHTELVRGEVRAMSPGNFDHGVKISRISGPLIAHVRNHRLGEVCAAETGFVLRRNPDTVRAPDVSFVSTARLPSGPAAGKFYRGAPDLAVEVSSPSDTVEEMDEKVREYLTAGTRLVWVVNPRTKTITVYDSPAAARILGLKDTLTGGDVLPGFALAVRDVFS